MLKCAVCGCSEFYKTSGYFFCTTCQTQSQDMGEEMELELPIGNTTKLRKGRKIHRTKSDRADEELGWTSWELYNFVLIGLTNEIIQLGVSPDVKVTVLQLWARYLGKLEIAFVSVKKKLMPKLARRYKKGDADIIYGKTLSQKRVRKRGKTSSTLADSTASTNEGISSRELIRNKKLMITADYDRFVRSQASSEGDVLGTFDQSVCSTRSSAGQSCASTRIQFNSSAKEETRRVKDMAKKVPRHKRNKYKQSYVTTRYKTGPELITPTKLWAILYLALRIHNQDIHLGDMIRYGREGHLSYYRLDHLVPAEVALTRSDMNFLSRAMDITHKGMRRIIGRMAKFLGVTGIICPDLLSLVNRYCTELALPKGISSYAERLVSLSVPKMRFDKRFCIPNYEGRAMAFIIVVLKTLLGLDGITENEISNVADKINSAISDEGICDTKLFSFREWQKYVECRKAILINAHCPTKLKYNPNVPDVNSLYMKFFESVDSKADRGEPEIIMHKHLIPRDLVYALKQCIGNVSGSDLPLNKVNTFSPTLTPNHSYLQQLLRHPLYDLPSMLQSDFSSAKSGYLTRSESVYKLALQYGIQLASVESNLHFLEKTVTLFEQAKIASMKELKSDDAIEDFMEEDAKCVERKEDFIDYLHKKIPCHLKIDGKKIKCYDDIRVTASTDVCAREKGTFASSEFIFGETLPDGKLSIPGESADESEASSLIKFCKAYNTNLSSTEKKAIFQHLNWSKKRKRRKLVRNVHGKFVKPYPSDGDSSAEEIDTISANTCKIENILPEIPDNSNSSINAPMEDKVLRLFKPFQDYWMYHCNFSRVKPKNFDLLEKMLPRSFRWLLNESASVVEMSTEDLYEEVCLVEGYYAYVSERSKIHSSENYNNRAHINAIFKKW
ncbi:PREDICTED: TATA box-binding protein-associated factor RNA polymerase I subunit B [Vollenhovia emeryi]|uniref:TATA box-binding protein-associated factor RNA polymerase I subunit B n=1 Tax=Vollenhovia emeryi TaxID=411798 RepID=UPI0005F470E8|nr:PREDICTED: TATA box-binding protein-associated factor RNA polymerase I subunit B [Vollenhovia emeryi]